MFNKFVFYQEAERKGFEPSIHFWRIYTFQAYSFNHSDTSLFPNAKVTKYFFIPQIFFLIFY